MKRAMKRTRRTFRKYFVPHEENDFRPHIFRAPTVAFVCALALVIEGVFLFGSSYVIPRSELFGEILVNALVGGTNQARVADGLPALHESPLLDLAAQEKANDMVKNEYFAHTSPAGLTPWYWFYNVGYDFTAAGENLAVNFTDSADVTNAWLNSPEHRANILDSNYTDIGMATAQGTFEGHPAIYVVELFGAPAPAAIPVANAAGNAAGTAARAVQKTPSANAAISSNPAGTAAVAVKGASTISPAPTSVQAAALSPASAPAPAASPAAQAYELNAVQSAAANPRKIVDEIYFAIALLFGLALVANFAMKLHLRHPQLIFGGMLVVLIAGLLIVLNQHFGTAGVVVL